MADLSLDPEVVAALRERLPVVAAKTIEAVTSGQVPEYANAFSGRMGANIEGAVQLALDGFLQSAVDVDAGAMETGVRDGAYSLGRGEARSGRTMDALLAAYRLGARVAWRELSTTAVESGAPADTVAQFAELVFDYIDRLSAVSAAGHTDELATSGRVREQYRERLGLALLSDASTAETLTAAAQRADWEPPSTLTAVLLPSARARDTLALLDPRTLNVPDELDGYDGPTTVLLVPDADRRVLMAALRGRSAVVGPPREWTAVAASYRRAVRTLFLRAEGDPVDTETQLTTLVLTADPEALQDLRNRVLEPLASLKPATADRLAETLRSWLLHQGRRDDVAADLVIHAQTVRYRMTQLRELYGDRLTDPASVLELTVALA